MSRLIVLYNYNKYYNRIIKLKSTFQGYLNLITPADQNTPAQYKGFIRENLNFNYEDGIYASHIINIRKEDPEYMKIEHPDYMVVETTYVEGEGDDAITSTTLTRYFIISCNRIRGNQWELSLKRDVLADYYNDVLNAPVFIEKGWCNSLSDPAIFNKESMTFNQIKKAELLLDKTKLSGNGGGWIVGYLAKEESPTALGPATGKVELPLNVENYDDLPSDLKNLISSNGCYFYHPELSYLVFNSDLTIGVGNVLNYGFGIREFQQNSSAFFGSDDMITEFHNDYSATSHIKIDMNNYLGIVENVAQVFKQIYDDSRTDYQIQNKFNAIYSVEKPNDHTINPMIYNGRYFKGTDNKYYQVIVTRDTAGDMYWYKSYTETNLTQGSDALAIAINNYLQETTFQQGISRNYQADASKYVAAVVRQRDAYTCKVVEVSFSTLSVTIPDTRNQLLDAPYDMFCMPMGNVDVKGSGNTIFTTLEHTALAAARALALKGGSLRIYDIQILPYCPFPEVINSDGSIDITDLTSNVDFTYVYDTSLNTAVNIVLLPMRSKGTFDIEISQADVSPEIWDYMNPSLDYVIRKKIKSETRLARFVSPNFASMFDINVEKNNGITILNVDYFYKPYSPYLHVAPYFSGLYGQDFNDPKGLICSGDFSIATASSKWEEYQIQNKNFEVMFDRQIQNLDINNSLAYQVAEKSSGIGVATSTLTGAGAGAAGGAMIGSAILPGVGTAVGAVAGAVAGGVAGGVTSGVGRKYDLEYLAKSQAEARSYAVDMYAYNLGNIKALPNTLTKVSAFTTNNKIFPFIEFYDCTDQERTDFTAKLRYNGMTIMRIGKIADYLGEYNYVSGQLIRLTGIKEDSEVVAEIAKEIKEGAYYYGSDSE